MKTSLGNNLLCEALTCVVTSGIRVSNFPTPDDLGNSLVWFVREPTPGSPWWVAEFSHYRLFLLVMIFNIARNQLEDVRLPPSSVLLTVSPTVEYVPLFVDAEIEFVSRYWWRTHVWAYSSFARYRQGGCTYKYRPLPFTRALRSFVKYNVLSSNEDKRTEVIITCKYSTAWEQSTFHRPQDYSHKAASGPCGVVPENNHAFPSGRKTAP